MAAAQITLPRLPRLYNNLHNHLSSATSSATSCIFSHSISSTIFAHVMDIRRRLPKPPLRTTPLPPHSATSKCSTAPASPRASDTLPLPLFLTNGIFFTLFFSIVYFLLHRWREKIRNSIPLHVLSLSELAALISLIASFIYLLGFFGIDFVQSVVSKSDGDIDEDRNIHCSAPLPTLTKPEISADLPEDEECIINRVVSGEFPSYSLESKLSN